MANARLAASVAKNMNYIKRGLKLDDDQAIQFQTALTRILSDAFGGGGGGGEEGRKGAAVGQQGNGGNAFRELSRDEYAKLPTEEKKRYREAWKAWKSSLAR